jgi:hypothetical protein
LLASRWDTVFASGFPAADAERREGDVPMADFIRSRPDSARVLGHAVKGMSDGVYSSGPGLKRLAAVVEEIAYPGLSLHPSKE